MGRAPDGSSGATPKLAIAAPEGIGDAIDAMTEARVRSAAAL